MRVRHVSKAALIALGYLVVCASPILAQEVQREQLGDAVREAPQAAGDTAAISFIDTQSAYCYQPDPRFDVCYVNWYYNSVSASPNYMIFMQVTLDGRVANYVQGFFQTSMYLPYNAMGKGFRVACGGLGAGGNPELGNAYAYKVNAKDSAGLTSANYGTVYCPAYIP